MKEYKVLSQKDGWVTGKFNPEALEKGLNDYAAQGWTLNNVSTSKVKGLTGEREEMVIILER